ncbi:unnamed protein product [Pleuronectes platessa]|uniref:Uncharacterized protein n=1 Tax=Pleuronectes platessa TaxID=8262 RepID=A0A9N7UF57_PLEPL|nr:unnamed protein product [Pleuronectes platessa]
MKPTETGSYALLNQALTPKANSSSSSLLERWRPSSHPSSPPSDRCSPNSINSGSIRASLHVARLKVKPGECPSRPVPANYATCHAPTRHTWLTHHTTHITGGQASEIKSTIQTI